MRQKFKTTLRDVVFPYFLIFLGTTVLPTLLINVPFINIPLILLCWPLWEMRPELTATQYGHVEWLFFGTILEKPMGLVLRLKLFHSPDLTNIFIHRSDSKTIESIYI